MDRKLKKRLKKEIYSDMLNKKLIGENPFQKWDEIRYWTGSIMQDGGLSFQNPFEFNSLSPP